MTGKRRWILLGPKEASYMKTDREVLAEMGGTSEWRCVLDRAGNASAALCFPPEHGWKGEDNPAWAEVHRGCVWAWIVPEGGER
jgi:hypothetical protein